MAKVSAQEDKRLCLKVPGCGDVCHEFTDMEHACVLDEGHPGTSHECICGFKFEEAPLPPAYTGRAA